jgi:hypothetical protein
LAKTLIEVAEWRSDFWRALLQGWSQGSLSDEQWTKVFILLISHGDRSELSDDVARLLVVYIQGLDEPSQSLDAADRLSDVLFGESLEQTGGSQLDGPDWLTSAINTTGGKIAEFWARVLSRMQQIEPLESLPDKYQRRFDLILKSTGKAADAARVFLCAQLHFVNAIDDAWTRSNLLPEFEWRGDDVRTEQAWQGFLIWGRLNESVIDSMLPLYSSSFSQLSRLPSQWRSNFTNHLSIIAVLSSRDLKTDGWLVRFVREAPTEDRASWASHVGFRLRDLDASGKTLQWEKWIREYWANRIRGLPKRLAKGEASEMEYWPIALAPIFERVVDFVLRGPIAKPRSYVYHELEKARALHSSPSTLQYLRHLLQGEVEPFHLCSQVETLAEAAIRAGGGSQEDLAGVVESLAQVGCTEATYLLASPV